MTVLVFKLSRSLRRLLQAILQLLILTFHTTQLRSEIANAYPSLVFSVNEFSSLYATQIIRTVVHAPAQAIVNIWDRTSNQA